MYHWLLSCLEEPGCDKQDIWFSAPVSSSDTSQSVIQMYTDVQRVCSLITACSSQAQVSRQPIFLFLLQYFVLMTHMLGMMFLWLPQNCPTSRRLVPLSYSDHTRSTSSENAHRPNKRGRQMCVPSVFFFLKGCPTCSAELSFSLTLEEPDCSFSLFVIVRHFFCQMGVLGHLVVCLVRHVHQHRCARFVSIFDIAMECIGCNLN